MIEPTVIEVPDEAARRKVLLVLGWLVASGELVEVDGGYVIPA